MNLKVTIKVIVETGWDERKTPDVLVSKGIKFLQCVMRLEQRA